MALVAFAPWPSRLVPLTRGPLTSRLICSAVFVLFNRAETVMFDGWYSASMILLAGLLATLLAVIVGWRLSKSNRKPKSAKQRRADRIDLTGRAKE
jgi:uncharacterized membrane protein